MNKYIDVGKFYVDIIVKHRDLDEKRYIKEKKKIQSIININTIDEAREVFGKDPRWLNYKSKICKNDFMKEYLLKKEPICPVCGKQLQIDDIVIHHKDYCGYCYTEETISIKKPTRMYPNRKCKTTKCETCKKENPDCFKDCESRIVGVHRFCNCVIDYFDERKIR